MCVCVCACVCDCNTLLYLCIITYISLVCQSIYSTSHNDAIPALCSFPVPTPPLPTPTTVLIVSVHTVPTSITACVCVCVCIQVLDSSMVYTWDVCVGVGVKACRMRSGGIVAMGYVHGSVGRVRSEICQCRNLIHTIRLHSRDIGG